MADQDQVGPAPLPTEEQVRLIIAQTLEQVFIRAQADTQLLLDLRAKVEGVEAHTHATVAAVDANENEARMQRAIDAQKEIISHLFDKSHNYVTVIVAGAFAAYFATLSTVAPRLNDVQLRWSALLMTVSLTIFVFWEVFNMAFIGYHNLKGDYGLMTTTPRWTQITWSVVLLLTIVTALPAIGLSIYAYLNGLGAFGAWRFCSL